MNYAPIGSISHGTLREQDLLTAFAEELNRLCGQNLNGNTAHQRLYEDAVNNAAMDDRLPETDEEAAELLAELEDALTEYAPPFCYFGAHEGDGSDFGFWPSQDIINDAISEEELIKVSDLSEIPSGYTGYVLVVNDHGNMDFYEAVISYRPLFSVV